MTISNLVKGVCMLTLSALTPQNAYCTTQCNNPDTTKIADTRFGSVIPDPATMSDGHMPGIPSNVFKAKQLILPGALFAVGTFGVYNGTFRKIDTKIKNGMDHFRGNHYFRVDDWVQYLPAVTYFSFGSIGVSSKHSFKERVAVEATAYLSMAALVNIGKYSFREKRPDSNARNSFPSGHTATVFTGAELMREEYGLGLGIASYGVATAVAFLRLYNGRHWFNDVVAGAGIGILSARIGYWMLPVYRKWFGWNKATADKTIGLMPSCEPYSKNFSVNFTMTF